MKQVELLAPAGSFECLQAAIQGKADAIYFGVEQLNMRAKSANTFGIEDLDEIVSRCRENNLRCYLTLNTIIYNHDLRFAREIIKQAKAAGVDGIIASDYAVFQLCIAEGIPLHISTQANISNIESVIFHSKFSDVIVLARELTLKQVEEITKEIKRKDIRGFSGEPLKIEVFVHGALCMAVSGKCYISLHTQNASANRGACAQNCRRPYKVIDSENDEELLIDNEYIMSPKDLCTIDILDQVINTGVDVLKIEGRSKSADYVYTTTKCYREALEALKTGTYTREKAEELKKELNTVYNRGFWEGYYLGRKLGEWTNTPGNNSGRKKIYLGKADKFYPAINVAEFTIDTGTLKTGDSIMITGPKTGVYQERLEDFRVDGNIAEIANKGDKITFGTKTKISKGDKLYKVIEDGEDHSLS